MCIKQLSVTVTKCSRETTYKKGRFTLAQGGYSSVSWFFLCNCVALGDCGEETFTSKKLRKLNWRGGAEVTTFSSTSPSKSPSISQVSQSRNWEFYTWAKLYGRGHEGTTLTSQKPHLTHQWGEVQHMHLRVRDSTIQTIANTKPEWQHFITWSPALTHTFPTSGSPSSV